MKTLQNKIILLTGGGQGLGKAITQTLAKAGGTIICVDIKVDQVEMLAKELQKNGKKVYAKAVDITSDQQVTKMIKEVMGEFGRIDVLINNAGIDVTKPILDMSQEEYDKVLNVNLRAPIFLSRLIYPYMLRQRTGHIINITSTAAKRAWPNASAYHASKWGLLGFSYALFSEGKKDNIKVSAVVAGGMRTPFILERFPDTPLDVLQDPKNVAQTILFLLTLPDETVIPEIMVLPKKETSWP